MSVLRICTWTINRTDIFDVQETLDRISFRLILN